MQRLSFKNVIEVNSCWILEIVFFFSGYKTQVEEVTFGLATRFTLELGL